MLLGLIIRTFALIAYQRSLMIEVPCVPVMASAEDTVSKNSSPWPWQNLQSRTGTDGNQPGCLEEQKHTDPQRPSSGAQTAPLKVTIERQAPRNKAKQVLGVGLESSDWPGSDRPCSDR
ncbi:Homologous Recombination Ob-Fold Protein [Manis pentadactyla]|nr:Homologous Recombination Ob-Fold Protein [Manis pentadactyla]